MILPEKPQLVPYLGGLSAGKPQISAESGRQTVPAACALSASVTSVSWTWSQQAEIPFGVSHSSKHSQQPAGA